MKIWRKRISNLVREAICTTTKKWPCLLPLPVFLTPAKNFFLNSFQTNISSSKCLDCSNPPHPLCPKMLRRGQHKANLFCAVSKIKLKKKKYISSFFFSFFCIYQMHWLGSIIYSVFTRALWIHLQISYIYIFKFIVFFTIYLRVCVHPLLK